MEKVVETVNYYNCTLHDVVLYNKEDCIEAYNGRRLFLKEGATPYRTIKPSGIILNAVEGNKDIPDEVKKLNLDIKCVGALTFLACDPLPSEIGIYIVSAKYRNAREILKLPTTFCATVQGVIYKSETNIVVGCLDLAIG